MSRYRGWMARANVVASAGDWVITLNHDLADAIISRDGNTFYCSLQHCDTSKRAYHQWRVDLTRNIKETSHSLL